MLALLAVIFYFFGAHVFNSLAIRWINERFPPRSTIETQSQAISSSYRALSEMEAPSVSFTVSKDTLSKLIAGSISALGDTSPVKVEHLAVSSEQQQIRISTDFVGHFDDYTATVIGRIDGAASIAFEGDNLVLTPTFDRIELSSLSVSGWHLPGRLSTGLAGLLSKVIDNANGQIKPTTITVAKELLTPQKIELGDKSFTIPAQNLVAQSLLMDEGRVIWLGQINGGKATAPTETVGEFAKLKAAFVTKGGQLVASAPKDGLMFSPSYIGDLVAKAGLELAPSDRAKASLEAAWLAVHHLSGPDISVVLPSETIEKYVKPLLGKALDEQAKRSKVDILERQLIFNDGRIALVVVAKSDLPEPVGGSLTFRLGVSVSPVVDTNKISLLPSIDEISVVDVSSAKLDAGQALIGINNVISGLVVGLNQAFPSIPVDIRPFEIEGVDLEKTAAQTPGLTLSPSSIPSTQARFTSGAALVTASGIQILADVDIDSGNLMARTRGADPAPYSGSVSDIEKVFAQRRMDTLVDEGTKNATIDLSWARLAQVVNAKWRDVGGIRASYAFDTGSQEMEPTEIRLVEKPTYACEQKTCEFHGCSFNSCADSCQRDSCDWACGQGICSSVPCPTWRNPGRFCQKCTGDPICEGNKVTCSAGREINYQACRSACDIKANTDKAACDVRANADKAACDTQAVALKAACDLGNAIQDVANKVGGIGKIGGDARAIGVVGIDAASLALSESSPGVVLSPIVAGRLTTSGSIDFMPYDIGHLLVCPAKGKASFSVGADLPRQQPALRAALNSAEPTNNLLRLTATIDDFNLRAKLSPPPIEAILSQNPQLLVDCNPVLIGVTTGLTILGKAQGLSGSDVIKALAGKQTAALFTGDVDYDVKGFEVPIPIRINDVVVGDQTLVVRPKLTGKVVGVSLDP
jgi:hypothetical protein